MKSSYFLSVESHTPALTKQILPGAEFYGITHVVGISKNVDNDISCINEILRIADEVEPNVEDGVKKDCKYNANFFPHLPSEFTFAKKYEEGESEVDLIESKCILCQVSFKDEDDTIIAHFAACYKPKENPFSQMFSDADHHFYKESVSSSVILN
jgi:hypothetical protein